MENSAATGQGSLRGLADDEAMDRVGFGARCQRLGRSRGAPPFHLSRTGAGAREQARETGRIGR